MNTPGSWAMPSTPARREYHLIVARDTQAISVHSFRSLVDQVIEVRRMLYGLTNYLERKPSLRSDVPPH